MRAEYAYEGRDLRGGEAERLVRAAYGLARAIDHGFAASLWDKASVITRSSVVCDDFVTTINKIRSSLGVPIRREWRSIRGLKVTETGAVPPGLYANIEFVSKFVGDITAHEMISLREDEDGVWRLTGYSVERASGRRSVQV